MEGEVKLGLMCGLPRSGKTTYARKLSAEGWVRICPDDYRLALHGQAHLPSAESIIWAMVEVSVRAFLIGGQSVIIDATNTIRWRRSQWVRLAQQQGVEVSIFWIPTPFAICQERNQGDGAVPDDTLLRMHRQFEPPTMDEGIVTWLPYG